MVMQIFPAIDLRDGKAVRLRQGRFEEATVYADDPVTVAREFYDQGAEFLHIVDLDGALAGKPVNDETIQKIVREVPLKVQVGGGIRSLERIAELLALGVERVILGTVAVREPELVKEAVKAFGEKVVVGIDAQNGYVAVQGWAETTEVLAIELGKSMREVGVERVIFTDISRDGMLQGPNIASTVELARQTGLKVIASGGVSSLEDLRRLREEELNGAGIEGAIIGKALYAKAFTLREAIAVK